MAVTETGQAAARELDELYRRHGAQVYRYALAVLGNHSDAEDVTQTTFLSAYDAIERGVKPRKPENWLLTIASNAIKQRFRQESARPREVMLDDEIAGSSPDEEGPSVGELLAALAKIPPQQRQAIVLREFEGRSYAEIAGILGVTHSALETLLFRARRSLAEELEHQLTCTEAQLAISRAADERLGRKERRRLREHLGECPDCARFARLQQRHRKALKGLMLVPVPVSLSLLRGLEGTASAALVPATATATTVGAATVGAGAAVVGQGAGIGVGAGAGTAGGGVLAGGLAVKAAAVVSAAVVTGGVAVTGANEIAPKVRGDAPGQSAKPSTAPAPGKRLGQVAPRGTTGTGNGVGASVSSQARAATPATTRATKAAIARAGGQGAAANARATAAKPSRATPKPSVSKPVRPPKGAKPAGSATRAAPEATSQAKASAKPKSHAISKAPKKPAGHETPAARGGQGSSGGKPEK